MRRISYTLFFLAALGFSSSILAISPGDLLPAEQAFVVSSKIKDDNIILSWDIADGYYLYRDEFSFEAKDAAVSLANPRFPKGEVKYDPAFGEVEIYRKHLAIILPFSNAEAQTFILALKAQGCADVGVCYPPMKKELSFDPADYKPAEFQKNDVSAGHQSPLAEQDRIALALKNDALVWTALSFFGFGLLLAFTPCCLPMIPILSGIIVGHGDKLSTSRAFFLSLTYVIATALTYTVFGILAGLFGSNLQAIFQSPWVIGSFSAVFVLLSLSMFGFYQLQLPAALQSKATSLSNRQKGGSIIGVGIMGILSALIVGPCVAAPLAGALIYIGQTGDAVLGGIALFMMGLGMGAPLLIVGISAGTLLPRAGTWMESVKKIFGVLLLAVAIWLLGRIVSTTVTLLLWALLLIIPAVYLGALDALPARANGWHKMRKGVGVVFLLYGSALFIGVLSGASDPYQPLKGLAGGLMPKESVAGLPFVQIKSNRQLDEQLQLAVSNKQWLMVDFYADWCVSCLELEHSTFRDPAVRQGLKNIRLVQVDVTGNNELDQKLLKRFGLIGPPAIIFFTPQGQEQRPMRIIGYKKANEFVQSLQSMKTV